jgi:predicted HTH domain antitoxin
MYTHGLNTAMTLYRNGTLTLQQAASRAGRSPEAFETALARHGISVDDGRERSVAAD